MAKSRLGLAIPDEIKSRIEADAKAEHRSVHNKIICILTEHYENKDKQAKQE